MNIYKKLKSEKKQDDIELKIKQTFWSNEKSNFAEMESLIGLLWIIYLDNKSYSD